MNCEAQLAMTQIRMENFLERGCWREVPEKISEGGGSKGQGGKVWGNCLSGEIVGEGSVQVSGEYVWWDVLRNGWISMCSSYMCHPG